MAQKRFEQKTAIVTGSAGGVGAALVRRLVDDGANVVAVDIRAGDPVENAVYPAGRVAMIAADISTVEGWDSCIRVAVERFGGVQLLVNNAGVLEKKRCPLYEMPVEEFDRVFSINARGVFLGLRAVMGHMVKQAAGGAIVNVSSMGALRARATAGVYGASKRAVIGLSNAAALEGGKFGIRVNCICPGPIDTDMPGSIKSADPAVVAARFAGRALPRFGTPEEIVNFITYLLSDEASYQTGGVYTIDGGAVV
jgi:3alpha(or 20beta)-hydroxysteroid dehydrogenase